MIFTDSKDRRDYFIGEIYRYGEDIPLYTYGPVSNEMVDRGVLQRDLETVCESIRDAQPTHNCKEQEF